MVRGAMRETTESSDPPGDLLSAPGRSVQLSTSMAAKTDQIRNVAVLGGGGAGKTSLLRLLLLLFLLLVCSSCSRASSWWWFSPFLC